MKINKKKGSALIVSFIVLSTILISALSLASVSIKERNAAISAGKSNKSFQYADRGIEDVMYKIKKGGATTVSTVRPSNTHCSDRKIKKNDETYEVSLLDSSGNLIDCNSSDPVTTISKIKSVGIFGGDKRAVEASVGGSGAGCSDTCSSLGYTCGTHSICGTSTNCGSCGTNQTCNGSGTCVSSCSSTCSSLGYTCGTHSICGTSTNCGSCGTNQTCNGSGTCVSSCSSTCSSLGYTCGTHSICGTSTNCGSCGTNQTCNGSGTCVSSCVANYGAECDNGSWTSVPCSTICVTAKVDCGAHVTKHCYPGPITNWTSGWVQTTNCAASKYTFFLDSPCYNNVFNSIPGKINCAGSCISN